MARKLSSSFNYAHTFLEVSSFFVYKHLNILQNCIFQGHAFSNDNWDVSIFNPFLWSLLFIFKWKLLWIPFIIIPCSRYFPTKYIFNQTFWKYFSLKQELEQTSSKAGYPLDLQINAQSYFYTCLVNYVTVFENEGKYILY